MNNLDGVKCPNWLPTTNRACCCAGIYAGQPEQMLIKKLNYKIYYEAK